MNERMVDGLMPASFLASGLGKTGVVIDGRDIIVQTPRLEGLGTILHSSKSNKTAFRGTIGIHPTGLPRFVLPLVNGRCPETVHCDEYRESFNVVSPKHLVLADKGYASLAGRLPQMNTVVMPGFKRRGVTNFQFSPRQLDSNDNIAKNRYVVEIHFARAASFKLVDDQLDRVLFPLASNAWLWANAATVFMKPLKQPHGERKFETLGEMYVWARGEYPDMFIHT